VHSNSRNPAIQYGIGDRAPNKAVRNLIARVEMAKLERTNTIGVQVMDKRLFRTREKKLVER